MCISKIILATSHMSSIIEDESKGLKAIDIQSCTKSRETNDIILEKYEASDSSDASVNKASYISSSESEYIILNLKVKIDKLNRN